MAANKKTKVLGSMKGGTHGQPTYNGARTTDDKKISKTTMGNDSTNGGSINNTYVNATVANRFDTDRSKKVRASGKK